MSPSATQPASSDAPLPARILLYDGVCGFCNGVVQFILAHDPAGAFRFAALQGETAARLRAAHPEIPRDIETMVFIEDGQLYLRSRAAFAMARHLGAPWRWASVFRVLPAFFTDLGYNAVAAVRYRIWGKYESCPLPSKEQRGRFLP